MKIIQETTRFINDEQIDINYLLVQKYNKPLAIATREGQIHRILAWQDQRNVTFSVVGWWDLINKGYMSDDGLIRTKWIGHDVVIFLDSARAGDKEVYETLKKIVSNLL